MDSDLKARMTEVSEFVKNLQPEVQDTAFKMMEDYIIGVSPKPTNDSMAPDTGVEDNGSMEDFFGSADTDKPADAVLRIAAYLYSLYGIEPFSITEVKDIGEKVGLTTPTRIDMTLRAAKRGGKSLFRNAGRALYAPTVNGEKALKDDYSVKKGRNKRPTSDK